MKSLLAVLCALSFSTAFASPLMSSDLKIARGEGEHCMGKAFMAANPTNEQKAKAHAIHQEMRKVAEENHPKMEAAARAFMEVMMAHPIPAAQAVEAAHGLGQAVHPVKAAMFSGTISIINLLSNDQRNLFNKAMHDCMHE